MHSATLLPREDRRLLRGHLWVYRNEFKQLPELEDGEMVDVFSAERRLVGRGFYQNRGGIAVRLLSRHQEELDPAFFATRIAQAHAFRERLFPGQAAYRWIFGESDGLPGLVADRYGSVVSARTSCAFYSQFADQLAEIFLAHPGVEGLQLDINNVVRNFGVIPDQLTFALDGLQLGLQLTGAQKTGMFLDQRVNAQRIRPFAPGARVLDGHCYVGVWSCHAALAGATAVIGVDSSEKALEQARENARINGVADRCTFECAEVETVLQQGALFDVVLLDPPAYAKTRAVASKALARYQALNVLAMNAVEPGGILISSSCSHFVDEGDFLEMLKRAAGAAKRQVLVLEFAGAAPDHPVLLSMPETKYLKCAVLRVL